MKSLVLIGCLSLLMVSKLPAQKVAVVLSGGGAKGIAHVGALKALEENGIPIDAIAGTSMGGVVGGFYAAGYSPQQLEQIVISDEFQDWINGRISKKQRCFLSQQDPTPSWLTLNFRLDSSFNLTSSIANDNSLNFQLATMLAQASQRAGNNFDSLFVPFRTTGSEIFTQELVNLKSGRLNEAVRATMTVPLFYRPIKVNGRYLFDGGIYNNFPIDIALNDFKPDIVIAVNVSDKNFSEYPADKDEQLITQALVYTLFGKADTMQGTDNVIYIHPNMSKFSSLDFLSAPAIKDSGYTATLRMMSKIKSMIQRRVSPDEVQQERVAFLADTLPLVFRRLVLSDFSTGQQSFIRKFFDLEKKSLTLKEISDRYFRLVSEDYFRRIIPGVNYNPSDKSFDFELKNASEGTLRVNPGGVLATRSSFMYLGLSYTRLNRLLTTFSANAYTGGFYKSAQFSTRAYIPTKPYLYIEPVFTINVWDYLDSDDFLVESDIPTILQQIDRKAGLQLGIPAGRKGKWVLQAAYVWNRDMFSNNEAFKATDQLDKLKFEGFRAGLSYEANTLNHPQYPSSGGRTKLALDYVEGVENYLPGSTAATEESRRKFHQWIRFKGSVEEYFNLNKISLGYALEAVFSNQEFFANFQASLLYASAANPFADSRTLFLQNFRANSYALGGLTAIYHFNKRLEFRLAGYTFSPLWKIAEGDRQQALMLKDQFSVSLASTAALVYHTPIGPVSLRFNYYDDRETPFTLMAHLGYLLYNRRSLD
ncbi:MAG: patatin [Bacteroidetes bacterium]|nr:MAG: patatin [Bacteroidota bacterium]